MRSTLVLESPKVGSIVKYLSKQPEFWKWLTGDENQRVTRVALRYVTVSALLRVWSAANMHTTDGSFVGQDTDDIDDIAGIPAFGRAMEFAGWLTISPAGVSFPNFLEHNAPDSIRREPKTVAERMREYRVRLKQAASESEENVDGSALRSVTPRYAMLRGEEKRREEKNNNTNPPTPFSKSRRARSDAGAAGAAGSGGEGESLIPIPADLDGADFRPAWQEWLAYRREHGLTLSRATLSKQLKLLAELGRSGAVEAIEQSIRGGWKGVFPPSGNGQKPKPMKRFIDAMREAGIEPAEDTSLPD